MAKPFCQPRISELVPRSRVNELIARSLQMSSMFMLNRTTGLHQRVPSIMCMCMYPCTLNSYCLPATVR